jgi:hypothetical protein
MDIFLYFLFCIIDIFCKIEFLFFIGNIIYIKKLCSIYDV